MIPNWPTKKLGEVISKYFSGAWGDEPNGEGNARVLRVSDIKPELIINYETVPVRKLKEKDLEKYRLQTGDIVVVKSSGSQTKIISGRAAIFDYKGDDIYIPCNFLIALRPNRDLILPMWLWVNLNSEVSKKFIKLIVGATTYPNLKPSEYLDLKIPLPPLKIQHQIVSRLDAIKKAQELNDKQIALAEELFQGLLERELDSKEKKWEMKQIKDVVSEISYGLSISVISNLDQKNGIPIITMADITDDHEIDFNKVRKIKIDNEIFKKFKLKGGDILFNWRNASKKFIGKTAIFDSNIPAINASFLLKLKSREEILNSYLFFHLFYLRKKSYFKDRCRLSANNAFNASELKLVKIPLPPLSTQRQIVEKLQTTRDYKKKLFEQKQKLQELFESVLNKSFKGEL